MIPFPSAAPATEFRPEYSEHSLLRGVVDSFFRNWKWLAALWTLSTLAAAAYYFLAPKEYDTDMTFLVRNSRADVVINPDGSSSTQQRQADVSDAQLSTEVQMLLNRDLVLKLLPYTGFKGGTAIERERALGKLQKALVVTPVVKSNMLRVKYTSQNPDEGAPLLEAMAAAYLDQHLEMHSNAGSFEFFDQQATDAENRWKEAQAKLLEFQQHSGVVSGPEQKDLLLRRQIDLQVALHQSEAELQETGRRMEAIRPKLDTMAQRIPTQSRRLPNQYSVERLNTMIAELQNRRTEMLTKYRGADRNVTQLDQQIADTTRALDEARTRVTTEDQTDVNPLRQSLEAELTREQGTDAGLRGRIQTMRAQDQAYQTQLAKIEAVVPVEQQLQRDAKVAEDNYMLYTKRREEARIGRRMDQEKIANVVLAEHPHIPLLPRGRGGPLLGAYLMMLLLSLVAVAILSRIRRTVETPWDLEAVVDAPVLGTVPIHKALLLPERLRGF